MVNKKIRNRRRGPDIVVKSINYTAVVSWSIIFIVFVIVSFAKPQVEGFFDRQHNISVTASWDKTLLEYSFYLMFLQLIVCAIGILINSTRHQRKTDKYNKSLIFFFSLSIFGL